MNKFYYNSDAVRPIAAPLPAHLKWSITTGGRFVSYVKDGPMVWVRSFEERNAALDAMRWLVSQRLTLNGTGCGAVLDDEKGIIVDVDEMDMPIPAEMPEVVAFIRSQRPQGLQR